MKPLFESCSTTMKMPGFSLDGEHPSEGRQISAAKKRKADQAFPPDCLCHTPLQNSAPNRVFSLAVGMFSLLVLMTFFLSPSFAEDNEETQKSAVKAAKQWLKILDSGDYEKTWDQASELVKEQMTKDYWSSHLKLIRNTVGSLISRKLMGKQYLTSLADAPDGEYVVIQFEAKFDNKKSAIETITPKLEADGVWRVSGYYIR